MNKQTIGLISVIILLLALTFFQWSENNTVEEKLEKMQNTAAEEKAKLSSTQLQLESLKKHNTSIEQKLASEEQRLNEEVQKWKSLAQKNQSTAIVAEGPTATPVTDPAPEPKEGMSKLMSAALKQQQENEMNALKQRLRLSPDQEKSVRGFLNRQNAVAEQLVGKMFNGKLDKKTVQEASKDPINLKKELKAVLTPDQFTEYEKYETEKNQAMFEGAANMEMLQLSPVLGLNKHQQDQVLNALYQEYHTQHALNKDQEPTSPDLGKTIEGIMNRKRESLRPILTPDQFKLWESHLESQREMLKAFVPEK
jgi:hypothetical protein